MRAADGGDSKKLRWIFRRAVAALSPPRLTSAAENSAVEAVPGTKADVQRRLRKVVLWCLEHLDLMDPRIKPALQLLECLLEKFQELVSEGTVGGRRHWLRLQMKFGGSAVPAADPEAKTEGYGRKRVLCQHNLRKDRCRSCQPCPHGNARFHCIHCSGCSHGHFKRNCAACNGCPHGKYTVSRCAICNPCPHGKVKRSCPQCSSCEHGKLRSNCRVCNACPHGRLKSYCKDCKGEKNRTLVVWNINFIFPYIGNFIIPTDELIFCCACVIIEVLP